MSNSELPARCYNVGVTTMKVFAKGAGGVRLLGRSSLAVASRAPGFTLLECMFVVTIIVILASIAVPTYHVAIVRAK